ncbi:MAG: phosphate ABC transporter permease subunit PstC [Bacilli bacterium]
MRQVSARGWNGLFAGVLAACVLVVIGAGLLALAALIVASVPAIREFGISFLWIPVWDSLHRLYGALPFLYGSFLTAGVAVLIAGVIGVTTAVALTQIGVKWLRSVLSLLLEALAVIPSVVYGVWALLVVVPIIARLTDRAGGSAGAFAGNGFGMLAGGVVLGVMVMPTVVAVTQEAIASAPKDIAEAAMALGATRQETVALAIMPFVRKGILGSLYLGLARAFGEAVAVSLVIGNQPRSGGGLLGRASTLASMLAHTLSGSVPPLQTAALYELGLVLFLFAAVFYGLGRSCIAREAITLRFLPW